MDCKKLITSLIKKYSADSHILMRVFDFQKYRVVFLILVFVSVSIFGHRGLTDRDYSIKGIVISFL